MGYKSVLLLLSLLLATTQAQAAQPEISPFLLNGRYIIAWSGIPLGRIIIEAYEDDTSYRMSIDTKTRGIGALITDEKRVITVTGTKKGIATYLPVEYKSRPHKVGDNDTVILTYDKRGDIAKRDRKNDDDPAWRPPVPVEEINTARDPVTAAFMLRRTLYNAIPLDTPEVGTRTYDGMRLATMSLIRAANARVEIMGNYQDTINVAIKRAPINGYTPKELRKYNKGDPEIRMYFSNDAAFLPVRATAKTTIGELSMTLVELKPAN